MQFFYRNIAGIHEPDNADADDIDNRVFGNIFHRSAETIYKQIGTGRLLQKSDIKHYLDDPRLIESIVNQAFEEEFQKIQHPNLNTQHPTPNTQLTLNGLQIINRQVIIDYLKKLLEIDQELAPFTVIDVERKITQDFTVHGQKITIKGFIDRLDSIHSPLSSGRGAGGEASQIRVIDYKTGGKTAKPIASMEEIFDPANITKKHSDYYLQTLLYATILNNSPQGLPPVGGIEGGSTPISPALIFIQHTAGDNYDPTLVIGGSPVTDIRTHKREFNEHLQRLLEEIYDPEQPFRPTDDLDRCKNCPYRKICRQ